MKRRSRVCDMIIAFFLMCHVPGMSFAQTSNQLPGPESMSADAILCLAFFAGYPQIVAENLEFAPAAVELRAFHRAISGFASLQTQASLYYQFTRLMQEILDRGAPGSLVMELPLGFDGVPTTLSESPAGPNYNNENDEEYVPWIAGVEIPVLENYEAPVNVSNSGRYIAVVGKGT